MCLRCPSRRGTRAVGDQHNPLQNVSVGGGKARVGMVAALGNETYGEARMRHQQRRRLLAHRQYTGTGTGTGGESTGATIRETSLYW
jgi:hypothetical protein